MVMRQTIMKQRRLLLTAPLSACILIIQPTLSILRNFLELEGVVDLIYNPRRTILLLQAEMMEIPHCDGLPFLVAQGVEAANHFQGESFGKEIEQILRDMRREKENIILIGMPGVGKTTVGKALGEEMGRTCVDVDQELERNR